MLLLRHCAGTVGQDTQFLILDLQSIHKITLYMPFLPQLGKISIFETLCWHSGSKYDNFDAGFRIYGKNYPWYVFLASNAQHYKFANFFETLCRHSGLADLADSRNMHPRVCPQAPLKIWARSAQPSGRS